MTGKHALATFESVHLDLHGPGFVECMPGAKLCFNWDVPEAWTWPANEVCLGQHCCQHSHHKKSAF